MKQFQFTELLKLFIPLGLIIILFFTVIFIIILPYSKNYLIENEHDKIKQLVESELQLLESLEKDVESGEISAEDAKKLAIKLIREQRHGEKQEFYFWIIDMSPILIMHPFRPDLENTYVGDFTDPKGNLLFQDMVDRVKEKGSGYVEYQWQFLDDSTTITDKKSYVKNYVPWGWIIGTGFYMEATINEINRLFLLVTLVSVLVMIIIIVVSGVLIKQRFEIRKRNKSFAKSLNESEKKYKVLIDSMNEGFIIQDQNESISLVNTQLCIMLDYSEKDLTESTAVEIVADKDKEIYFENIKKRLNREDEPFEINLKSSKGTTVPVIISPRGMFSDKGDYEGSFSTITNVSSLKMIEAKLSKSLDEKDFLLKELHHRVKNNLQIIISLLNMQKNNPGKQILSEMIKDFEARVYSIALVHEILYESENFKFIKLNDYISKLIINQMAIYTENTSDIKLDVQIEDIAVPIDQAITYGLIINELFTNSLHHAFKEKKGDKKIRIIAKIVDGEQRITFSDNGSGIPDDKIKDTTTHIGLKLIYLLTEQMSGTVELTSSDNGSLFELRLPVFQQ